MSTAYERKVSSEEASEGYIMVLKDRLTFFPPIGRSFDLREGDDHLSAKVEARDCVCRGPEKPHQHFFIRRWGLARGDIVRITADGDGYRLETTSG